MYWNFVKSFLHTVGRRAVLSVCLTIFIGLTHGVGLLMIIPLLGLMGLEGTGPVNSGIASYINQILGKMGLTPTLSLILLIYVLIVTLYALVKRYNSVLNAKLIYRYVKSLRDRMYESLSHMDWLSFIRKKKSDMIHTISMDLETLSYGIRESLKLTGQVVLAAVYITVALLISLPMTGFALLCGGAIFLFLRPLNQKAHRSGEKQREAFEGLFSTIKDHVDGMKIAKSYNLDNKFKTHFRRLTNQFAVENIRYIRLNSSTRMVYEIGAVTALSLFFYVAIHFFHLPAVHLLVIVFLFSRLLPRFSTIQQSLQRIKNTLPSFKKVNQTQEEIEKVKEKHPSPSLSPMPLKKEIRLEKVSFRYDKKQNHWALKDISLTLPVNTMTAIVGPSGAGKSTLADILIGLLIPDRGDFWVDGRALWGEQIFRWRKSVGYVPQDIFLFNDTVESNLRVARPDAKTEEIWAVLHTAAADELVSGLPQGLQTVLGDRGVRLSGGERQRIVLARALLSHPSLLLLDEATNSLDTENERKIQNAVDRLHGELTIVLIAHRSSTIQSADRILLLEKGRITEKGTWKELGPRYDSLYHSPKFPSFKKNSKHYLSIQTK